MATLLVYRHAHARAYIPHASLQLYRCDIQTSRHPAISMITINDGTFTEMAAFLAGGGEGAKRAARTLRDMSIEGPAARDAALHLGAVPALLPHLRPHTPLETLTLLTQAVSNWCRRDDNAPAVRLPLVAPALPLLKDLLLHGEADVVEAACTALTNLTHGPGAHTGALQAVPELTARLVALLDQGTDARVTRAALCAVANMLAGTSAQVERCLDTAILDYIVPLLRSSDTFLVEHAARATANIFKHAGSTEQALDVGVLAPLQNILDNGDDACRKQAMQGISNFCCYGTAAQRGRLVSSGLLQPYCAVLARPDHTLAALVLAGLNVLVQAAEKEDIDDRANCSGSDSDEDHEVNPLYLKLSETDILDLIRQLLQRQDIDENLRHLAQELNVAIRWHALRENLIIEDGKVYNEQEICQGMSPSELGAMRAARRMLCKALDVGRRRLREVSDKLMCQGIWTPLSRALGEDVGSDLQHEAVWILSSITFVERHKTADEVEPPSAYKKELESLLQGETVSMLVALLDDKGQVAAQAAYTLGNMAASGLIFRVKVLNSGTVSAMLPYLRPETPPRHLRAFLRAYQDLCIHHKKKADAATIGLLSTALASLPQLLDMDDQQVRQPICLALKNLMCDSDQSRDLVQAVPGLTECLLALLNDKAPKTQEAALNAMTNMLAGSVVQVKPVERCLNAGCLEVITPLLRSSDSSVVDSAVAIMVNIFASHLRERTLEKDVLTPLLQALNNGALKYLSEAVSAIALFFVEGTEDQLKLVLRRDVLRPYCSLLDIPRLTTIDLQRFLAGLYCLLKVESVTSFRLQALNMKLTGFDVYKHLSQLTKHQDSLVKERASGLLKKYPEMRKYVIQD